MLVTCSIGRTSHQSLILYTVARLDTRWRDIEDGNGLPVTLRHSDNLSFRSSQTVRTVRHFVIQYLSDNQTIIQSDNLCSSVCQIPRHPDNQAIDVISSSQTVRRSDNLGSRLCQIVRWSDSQAGSALRYLDN